MFLWNADIHLQLQHHKPENHNQNKYHHKNLRTCMFLSYKI
jgi:hypothetical protein